MYKFPIPKNITTEQLENSFKNRECEIDWNYLKVIEPNEHGKRLDGKAVFGNYNVMIGYKESSEQDRPIAVFTKPRNRKGKIEIVETYYLNDEECEKFIKF